MRKSLRKTTAFICAIALTAAPLTLSTHSLPSFAEEAVTVQSESGEVTQEQIEKNIIGTWIPSEKDGQPILTNEKPVIDILSTTEAYTSLSLVNDIASAWHSNSQCEISVNGNCLTITANTETGSTIEHQLTITDISSDKFTANVKSTLSENEVAESVFTFVKADDLSEAVLGDWEGKCTSEGSVFDDGKEHRWEYKADGTYVYYNKVGDEWVASDNTLNEYFVAGNLLCMRWVDNGTENREWWEISVKDGKMSWTALRADEEGSNFTAAFEMNKVSEVTQEQIENNIIGSWIMAEKNGQPVLTNEKEVYTMASLTKGYFSISRGSERRMPVWQTPSDCDISINGNVLTFINHPKSGVSLEQQFTITDISADSFTAIRNFIQPSEMPEPGDDRPAPEGERPEREAREDVITFVKVDDLSEAVLGTWEGKCTSEGSVFDDGKEHRWEYKPDGTYVYYNKVGDEWVPSDNTENEYFVSGNLLCMRWVDNGTENREWWEISVKDGKMSWTALRADEEGSNFTATFEMNKVKDVIKLKAVRLGKTPYFIDIPEVFCPDDDPVAEDVANGMIAFYQSDNDGHGIGLFEHSKNEGVPAALKDYADAQAAAFDSTAQKEEFNGTEVYSYKAVKEYMGKQYDTTTYLFDSGNTYIEIGFWPENVEALAGPLKTMNSLRKETLVPVKLGDSIYSVSMFESHSNNKLTDAQKEAGMTAYYQSQLSPLYVETFSFGKSGENFDTFEAYAQQEAEKNGSQAQKETVNGVEVYSYEYIERAEGISHPTKVYILDSVDSFAKMKFWVKDDDANNEMHMMLSTLTKENAASDFITPERMCEMAVKDYQDKHGNAAVTAEIGAKHPYGTIEIILRDEAQNIVDIYTVDQKTGIGKDSDNKTVDLPQTGVNSMGTAAAVSGALLLTTAGAWMVFKSNKKKDEEE